MQLHAGARLGVYEVTGPIGAGGMGEVYRARDTKLGRDVALKILPSTFAHDPERVARFNREAQVLAALNHPHIAAIHGLEDAGGGQVLVLEFVDGETLADRLQRGPLPIDEAVAIARQIADALGAAHDRGIIHRDLKPANIAVSSQDQVKVLDFGLARTIDTDGGTDTANSPTLTFRATQAGVVLGTAAYMSPEQAKGRVADKRTDIWAFGCVLYEMLSGRRAFDGEDVSDTLAVILRGDPNWEALPGATPSAVRSLIEQCLVKDRKDRIADVAVVQYLLRPVTEESARRDMPASRRQPTPLLILAAVALAGVAAYAGWTLHRPVENPLRTTRFSIAIPSDQIISEVVRRRHLVAVSADGSKLAYIANDQLYYRAMDGLEAVPVRGSHEQPLDLTFSPDGQWIAYQAGTRLKKIPVNGGPPVTLAEIPPSSGITWSDDRILIGAGTQGILEVPATGGTPSTIVAPDNNVRYFYGPQLLPGGKRLLFTVLSPSTITELASTAEIAVQEIGSGSRTTLLRGGMDGRYLPTGHLIFGRDGVLFANAVDIDRLQVRGGATGMVDGVAFTPTLPGGAMHVAVSDAGTLVYMPAALSAATSLAWRTRQGAELPIAAPPHPYDQPRVSPDNKRIVVHASDGDNDLWIWEMNTETLTRLTFERGVDSFPIWMTDSKRIAYVSSAAGNGPNLYIRSADGTGQPEALLAKPPESSGGALVINGVTPDGKFLIYSVGVPSNIMKLPLGGSGEPQPVLANPQYAERGAQVSPDGRWLTYQSDESGIFQVYVRPFPNVDDGRWQVSNDGGSLPVWAPNGRELFFVDNTSHVMSVAVSTAPSFSFGKPAVAFDFSDRPSSVYRNYDVAPDGRFVIAKESQRSRGSNQFVIVLNWLEELKDRVRPR